MTVSGVIDTSLTFAICRRTRDASEPGMAGEQPCGAATRGERACLFLRLHRGREHDRTALAWITHRNISCRLNARLSR